MDSQKNQFRSLIMIIASLIMQVPLVYPINARAISRTVVPQESEQIGSGKKRVAKLDKYDIYSRFKVKKQKDERITQRNFQQKVRELGPQIEILIPIHKNMTSHVNLEILQKEKIFLSEADHRHSQLNIKKALGYRFGFQLNNSARILLGAGLEQGKKYQSLDSLLNSVGEQKMFLSSTAGRFFWTFGFHSLY